MLGHRLRIRANSAGLHGKRCNNNVMGRQRFAARLQSSSSGAGQSVASSKDKASRQEDIFKLVVEIYGVNGLVAVATGAVASLGFAVYIGTFPMKNDVDARFNEVDERFNRVDERFNRVDARMEAGFNEMKSILLDNAKWHVDKVGSKQLAIIPSFEVGSRDMSEEDDDDFITDDRSAAATTPSTKLTTVIPPTIDDDATDADTAQSVLGNGNSNDGQQQQTTTASPPVATRTKTTTTVPKATQSSIVRPETGKNTKLEEDGIKNEL